MTNSAIIKAMMEELKFVCMNDHPCEECVKIKKVITKWIKKLNNE